MGNDDLLEKILTGVTNEDLRNDLLRHLIKTTGRRLPNEIPSLKDLNRKLDNEQIFSRMRSVTGGTGVSVARRLNISSQAFNNQVRRGVVSPKSIIDFHIKTGVSLDWLVGSWDGSGLDCYENKNITETESGMVDQTAMQYLSLVEIYDQHSGDVELKWCLSKRQICLDSEKQPIPDEFGAILSLITRYKDVVATPEKVKNSKIRHFQVRKVLAYVLGEPKMIRRTDAMAKKLTVAFRSGQYERPGKTEFRRQSAKDECLLVLEKLAEQNSLSMVIPEVNTIAWDYLIGTGSMSPRDWVIEKLVEYRKKQKLARCSARKFIPEINVKVANGSLDHIRV
jgi:hypothetical protein